MRRIASATVLIIQLLLTMASAAIAAEQPNILFIFTDDHALNAISAYGGPLAKIAPTPRLDRIASEGMLFKHCLVTNSICVPSRAVVLTGKYSHLNGQRTNHARFDGSQQTAPKLLQKAGYQTAIVGKWHIRFPDEKLDTWEFFDLQNDPMELKSRYGDEEYANTLSTMKKELERLRQQYKIED